MVRFWSRFLHRKWSCCFYSRHWKPVPDEHGTKGVRSGRKHWSIPRVSKSVSQWQLYIILVWNILWNTEHISCRSLYLYFHPFSSELFSHAFPNIWGRWNSCWFLSFNLSFPIMSSTFFISLTPVFPPCFVSSFPSLSWYPCILSYNLLSMCPSSLLFTWPHPFSRFFVIIFATRCLYWFYHMLISYLSSWLHTSTSSLTAPVPFLCCPCFCSIYQCWPYHCSE